VFTTADRWGALGSRDRYLDRIRAVVATRRRSDPVVSHQSAAVLLGLPLWDVALDRVHVTRAPPAWTDRSGVLCGHVARLRSDEIIELDGVLVTDPVRTALDLARSLRHEAAVVTWTRHSTRASCPTTCCERGSSTFLARPGVAAPRVPSTSPTGAARASANPAAE
jgi:hypothetical protein